MLFGAVVAARPVCIPVAYHNPSMPDPAANPNRFVLPTPERLSEHLEKNPPREIGSMRGRLPLLIIGVLAASLLLANYPVLALLPWVGLLVFMVVMAGRVQRNRLLHARVTRAWELALLREYREALRRAWTLLPLVSDQPELHGRCVAVIAHALDELSAYESATVAFDYLLERLPAEHPLAVRVRLQYAAAQVAQGYLADADDALRKLRPVAEERPNSQISASYALARLIQDVKTGHFSEAVEHAGQTAEQLRPLGVEAGYGHGLLAYCCDQIASHLQDPEDAERHRDAAARWWRSATLLIPPAALAYRFHELADLSAEGRP